MVQKFSVCFEITSNANDMSKENVAYNVTISGPDFQEVTRAYDELEKLLTIALTRMVFDPNIGNAIPLKGLYS